MYISCGLILVCILIENNHRVNKKKRALPRNQSVDLYVILN